MRLLTIALLLAMTSCTYHYHYHSVEKQTQAPTYRPLPYYDQRMGIDQTPRTTLEYLYPLGKSGAWYQDSEGHIGIGKPPKFMLHIDTIRINSTDSVGMYAKPKAIIRIIPHIDAGIGTTNPTHKFRHDTSFYDGPGSKNLGQPAPKHKLDVRGVNTAIGTSHIKEFRGIKIDTIITPR
jgi:hypothetical protein